MSFRNTLPILFVFLAWSSCPAGENDLPAVADEFRSSVLPILKTRCAECHGAEVQEARIRFDQLSTDFVGNRAAAQTWREALQQIQAGKMPPEEEPPLTADEQAIVTKWIRAQLDQAIARQRSTGGRVVLRRLNRSEYQHTMRDLLGLDMDYTRDLPPDARSIDGFRNNGQSLRMSAIHLEYYLDTARRALDKVIVNGAPPKVFRHSFAKSNVRGWRGPTETSNQLERAQKFLARIVDAYPEQGEFRVRVQARAVLRPNKGYPLLEVAVGYRPDTEVHFRVAAVKEVISDELQQFEFRGRIENFPLPVRGQGKYPGLVIRLRNVYDDGTPMPTKLEKIKRDGKEVKAFRAEPDLPQLLIESVEFEGPVYSAWPPSAHRRILFDSPLRDTNEREYLRLVFKRFMTRAYRREVTRAEVHEMLAFFASIRPHYTRFEDAVRETLAFVLIQPEFLYLMEPASKKRPLSDFELASRLSYFLWRTMPDHSLFQLAKRGLLRQPDVLRSEVTRLLADERSRRFAGDFVEQWLGLDTMQQVAVNSERYPEFRESLKTEFRQETVEFFRYLLHSNLPATLMLQADFTLVNEPLARHYGLPHVLGKDFRRVPLGSQRGGLLGHASVLLANSNGTDSHPVRRGVWIRDRLLDDPPAPPPPDVPDLDEADPEFAKLTVREQLEVHRAKASCASCHRNIDPWGIALEHFDAVGRWRQEIRAKHGDHVEVKSVLATDRLPDGTQLDGAASLRSHLVRTHQEDFARAIVRNLLTYALGRTLELSDDEDVDRLTASFVAKNYRLERLVQDIVASAPFQTK